MQEFSTHDKRILNEKTQRSEKTCRSTPSDVSSEAPIKTPDISDAEL
jgi:hypothetical protein